MVGARVPLGMSKHLHLPGPTDSAHTTSKPDTASSNPHDPPGFVPGPTHPRGRPDDGGQGQSMKPQRPAWIRKRRATRPCGGAPLVGSGPDLAQCVIGRRWYSYTRPQITQSIMPTPITISQTSR